jgi:hypothetical protein
VQDALEDGLTTEAARRLQQVLHTNPTPQAWYMAAQMTLDRDREQAIRHLKRALLLDPDYGDALTLLGQMGESRHITAGDVAEEVIEAVDDAPVFRRLSHWQQLLLVSAMAIVLGILIVWLPGVLFPHTGPANLAAAAPEAAHVTLYRAADVIGSFAGETAFEKTGVRVANLEGKRVLYFNVASSSGMQSVTVIIYDNISQFVRDSATHRELEESSKLRVTGNVLMAYDKALIGTTAEAQLIGQFRFITGT